MQILRKQMMVRLVFALAGASAAIAQTPAALRATKTVPNSLLPVANLISSAFAFD